MLGIAYSDKDICRHVSLNAVIELMQMLADKVADGCLPSP